jgi:hypothetical protein
MSQGQHMDVFAMIRIQRRSVDVLPESRLII